MNQEIILFSRFSSPNSTFTCCKQRDFLANAQRKSLMEPDGSLSTSGYRTRGSPMVPACTVVPLTILAGPAGELFRVPDLPIPPS